MNIKVYPETSHSGPQICVTVDMARTPPGTGFCIRPRVILIYSEEDKFVRLHVGDYDDSDYTIYYHVSTPTEGRFVFHELMNYLHDIEFQELDTYMFIDQLYTPGVIPDFYPDLGVPREWE